MEQELLQCVLGVDVNLVCVNMELTHSIFSFTRARFHQGAFSPGRVFTRARSPGRVHQGAFTKATDYNFPMWSSTASMVLHHWQSP